MHPTSLLDGLLSSAESCAWWWPFRGFVYPVPRLEECHLLAGLPHRDGGPAIRYRNGFSIYALNGVRVPEWLAMTPAHAIDPMRFADIDDADVRREFVRKVGVVRIFDRFATILDMQGDYTLGSIAVDPRKPRKYLKMLNPSLPGIWHLEAVHPSCWTVQHALNWRRYGEMSRPWKPEHLT